MNNISNCYYFIKCLMLSIVLSGGIILSGCSNIEQGGISVSDRKGHWVTQNDQYKYVDMPGYETNTALINQYFENFAHLAYGKEALRKAQNPILANNIASVNYYQNKIYRYYDKKEFFYSLAVWSKTFNSPGSISYEILDLNERKARIKIKSDLIYNQKIIHSDNHCWIHDFGFNKIGKITNLNAYMYPETPCSQVERLP